jgi:hypothetical protein
MSLVHQLTGGREGVNLRQQIEKIREVISLNRDIKAAIDAAFGAKLPKNEKAFEKARVKAIEKAMRNNLAFAEAVTKALQSSRRRTS